MLEISISVDNLSLICAKTQTKQFFVSLQVYSRASFMRLEAELFNTKKEALTYFFDLVEHYRLFEG